MFGYDVGSTAWTCSTPTSPCTVVSTAVVLLVLTRVPDGMVRFLHLAGACFLFYLAWATWRSWRRFDPHAEPEPTTGHGTILKAAFVNFLNPNPWLGWSLVMGPMFLAGYGESPSHGVALIVGFYVTMIVCLIGLITVFAFARRLGPQVRRVTLGLSVLALAGFGVFQLWLGIMGSGPDL